MKQRIFAIALILATAAYLCACSTTSTRSPTDRGTQDRDSAAALSGGDQQSMPSVKNSLRALHQPRLRTLADIERTSRDITQYEPHAVLEVLRAMEAFSSAELEASIASERYDPKFKQWLELVAKVRTTLFDSASIETAARQWAENHPGHVIDQTAFADIAVIYRSLFSSPARVAVLLPVEGALTAAGTAIRDGILSAYFENPGSSALRFYSSGKNNKAAIAAYHQAQIDGATQVIGPLRIGATRALGALASASVPLLLLNDFATGEMLTSPLASRVNSLTLSQTEEAAAIASRALSQGQKRAIVMVPDNARGTRIQSAFAKQFEAGDGQIVATARFQIGDSDQDALLQYLLRVDTSIKRKQDLEARLGIRLDFEPYRRHDFDFIFLAASPQQGRQFKPLLRFHDAGDVPVYAMGYIYNGQVARASDQDLNGIIFPITPWQLSAATGSADGSTTAPKSTNGGSYTNLYALGLDAWQILPWLPLLHKDPGLSFPAKTGSLCMLDNGHLKREPAWAKFSAGRPIPYQWPED